MAMTAQQRDAAERSAALAAVAHSLTATERVLFLGRARRRWPRFDGADVIDVLDYTTDYDEFLDLTEPFFERFGGQLPEGANHSPRMAAHVLIILGQRLTIARVICLMQRAGVTDAPRYPEVEVGLIAAVGGLRAVAAEANHLTLMARAEQGMRAAGIPEDVITEFRETVRRTGTPGFSRHAGDIAGWVTFVDRYTEMPRKIYDPTDDLAAVLHWLSMHGVDAPVRPAITNLRSHLDMRSRETIKASLLPFYGRAPE